MNKPENEQLLIGKIKPLIAKKRTYLTVCWVCIAVVAFLLCALFFGSLLLHTALAHEDADNVTVVHMTKNGFTPQRVSVSPGETVIFENTGNNKHWPASDDHPTHAKYDGTRLKEHCSATTTDTFDSCQGVRPGDSWSFTFNKVGVHNFHDHLWPHLKGKVVVQKELKNSSSTLKQKGFWSDLMDLFRQSYGFVVSLFNFDSSEQDIALKSGSAQDKFYKQLEKKYTQIVEDKNPKEAITKLKEASASNSRVESVCHDVIHAIGRTSYDKYGSFQEAAAFRTDYCNSGYLHGVFERYFQAAKNPKQDLQEQCRSYAKGQRQFDLWQCYHGIGHGFMYMTGGDLQKTLKLCEENLKDGTESCKNGAMMEVFNQEQLAKEAAIVNGEPFELCRSVNDRAKGDCYAYLPTYLLQTEDKSFTETINACSKRGGSFERICIRGTGAEALKRNMDNLDDVFALCKEAGSYFDQSACIRGAAGMMINQTGSINAGQKLCDKAPSRFINECKDAVQQKRELF